MIRSLGVVERWSRDEKEYVYRFCCGADAVLPHGRAGDLAVLRELAKKRQPMPVQPGALRGGRIRLPYQGWWSMPVGRVSINLVLSCLPDVKKRRTIGQISADLGLEEWVVRALLTRLHTQHGFAVVEDRYDSTVTIKMSVVENHE